MNVTEKISKFLTDAGAFFVATVDGDQPKCRPFGLHKVIDDKIYFGVGDFKDAYKQMCNNPKVEIVALKNTDWLRLYGKVVFEKDDAIANQILEEFPYLKDIYNEKTGYKMAVFHLEEATAEFRSIMKVEESYQF
ncbi:MAG: pyridoxamine 5'-phosphate oxidase [Syntrophomonadaceae bacterium]|nr:pyridoxamine 5'-phosphate oxidase [Syntrophomonadaceae bacterium]